VFNFINQMSSGVELVNISPFAHPLRTVTFSVPILLFSFYSLCFFRRVNSGATIIVHPRKIFTTLYIVPGKAALSKDQKSAGYIKSYNGPASSAILGLLLFAAAEFLLVLLFKQAVYHLSYPGNL
jgi:hypothetical protein